MAHRDTANSDCRPHFPFLQPRKPIVFDWKHEWFPFKTWGWRTKLLRTSVWNLRFLEMSLRLRVHYLRFQPPNLSVRLNTRRVWTEVLMVKATTLKVLASTRMVLSSIPQELHSIPKGFEHQPSVCRLRYERFWVSTLSSPMRNLRVQEANPQVLSPGKKG